MQVSVVTPDATLFEGEATQVIMPAIDGEFGVLANHVPLIAVLGHGVVQIDEPNKTKRTLVAVYGGFVKVQDNHVNVLAGGAALPEGSLEAAQQAVDQARKALHQAKEGRDPVEVSDASEALLRAKARLDLEQKSARA